MPAYNAAKYIEESIFSAQNQTFKDWELIVIDDGSIDDTAQIVKRLQKSDNRIVYFYQSNKRLGAARNAGLRLAKGKYIAFLDSDDLWYPEKLELQVKLIESNKYDLVFTNGYILNDPSGLIEDYPSISGNYDSESMYKMEFWGNHIPVLSVLATKEIVEKTGFQGETENLFGCEDWDFWLRMARGGAIFYGMPDKLFKYRVHDNGMSRNLKQMQLAEFTAIFNNLDYRYISKPIAYKRLLQLAKNNIIPLVQFNMVNKAKYEIRALFTLDKNIYLLISYLILFFKITPLYKFLWLILNPEKFNILIRRKLGI